MSTDSERELARSHFEQFLAEPRSFPMSVNIGGRCYEGIGPAYTLVSESTESSSQSVTVRRVYAHETGLQLELTLKQYPEYAAYEWSASLVNPSALPSPLVTEWEIASLTLPAANAKLCGILGDGGFHNDPYSPYEIQLSGASVTQFSPSGRGTYGRFPYFNISGDGGGFFFVIGWPGKWQASFSENNGLVTARARQKTLAARIPPKGRLISPLAVVLEYQGNDIDRAQNLWRRFFIDCNMRRPGGKLPEPHISGGTSWIYGEMKDATDENQIDGIRQYLDHGVPIDYWWMDAGWYYKTGEDTRSRWA